MLSVIMSVPVSCDQNVKKRDWVRWEGQYVCWGGQTGGGVGGGDGGDVR